ncbi:MAG: ribonuclease HII [Candidatus Omnitrophica bacterium]|nr:ribonuclease HII [Candidatus Omnitrophota bacterium]
MCSPKPRSGQTHRSAPTEGGGIRRREAMKRKAEERKEALLLHDRSFFERGFGTLAGVDEAGRGPLAGPVVASAVIVRDFSFQCPIDDSKKMTARLRAAAYEEIREKSWVGVGVVDHETIDRVNIYQATLMAMEEAIKNLGETPDAVLVDGGHGPDLPFVWFPIVNGDALSFSIACASIAAKVTRDRMMEQYDALYPEYGFKRHKGYGTSEHMRALKKHGPCRIHRRSFEPLKGMSSTGVMDGGYGTPFNH